MYGFNTTQKMRHPLPHGGKHVVAKKAVTFGTSGNLKVPILTSRPMSEALVCYEGPRDSVINRGRGGITVKTDLLTRPSVRRHLYRFVGLTICFCLLVVACPRTF